MCYGMFCNYELPSGGCSLISRDKSPPNNAMCSTKYEENEKENEDERSSSTTKSSY